jgi:hypothetical protein
MRAQIDSHGAHSRPGRVPALPVRAPRRRSGLPICAAARIMRAHRIATAKQRIEGNPA